MSRQAPASPTQPTYGSLSDRPLPSLPRPLFNRKPSSGRDSNPWKLLRKMSSAAVTPSADPSSPPYSPSLVQRQTSSTWTERASLTRTTSNMDERPKSSRRPSALSRMTSQLFKPNLGMESVRTEGSVSEVQDGEDSQTGQVETLSPEPVTVPLMESRESFFIKFLSSLTLLQRPSFPILRSQALLTLLPSIRSIAPSNPRGCKLVHRSGKTREQSFSTAQNRQRFRRSSRIRSKKRRNLWYLGTIRRSHISKKSLELLRNLPLFTGLSNRGSHLLRFPSGSPCRPRRLSRPCRRQNWQPSQITAALQRAT